MDTPDQLRSLPKLDAQSDAQPLSSAGTPRPFPLPAPRLNVSERRVLVWAIDIVVLNLSLLAALVSRYGYTFSLQTVAEAPHYFLVLSLLWMLWASFFDCYDPPRMAYASQSAWSAFRAALLTALIYLTIPVYTPHFPASRLSTYFFVSLVSASMPLWRMVYATVFSQPTFQQKVLIVGAGLSGSQLARVLAGAPSEGNPFAGSGYRVVGFVDDDPAKAGTLVADLPVLGNRHDLRRLVQLLQVDLMVVSITHTPQIHPDLFQALLDCREQGIRLERMTSIYERVTGRVAIEHAGRDLGVVLPMTDSATRQMFLVFKRGLDLWSGIVGMAALLVAAPLVALANAVASPGPLFFWQTRVGRGGRPFRLVKFRTMVPDAEKESGAVWACDNDSRVTPVGRFLRKTRLDELPQVWNVLRGEMSLIGPRPERPEFVADLVRQVPYYQARHAVRPGITGWAQVRYRYGDSVQDAQTKLEYDLYYIKHQGFYLEASILVKTAAVMLGFRGR